ncbi:MAG: protein kinase, partial [Clostridiaceae bacterium]|nr:protein kinase [Clostridiaceae bacterium]
MIGRILGSRYELLEKIGEGGMAIVYKAKCRLLNRFVAVKILKEEFSNNIEFMEKFKREAASVASLSSNNIVNIYDVGHEGDVNYIVMEYIKGKTLKQIILQNGSMDSNLVIDYGMQIAKALECAHKNNIIHRDIKPHNILITEDGTVKVTDFGIAKAASSVTMTNTSTVMGSAHYFSPEQAKGSFVDFRTDIYSFGIVLYEMTTGRVPYDAESPVSVALKHIQEPVIPPKNINDRIPSNLNKLIVKA